VYGTDHYINDHLPGFWEARFPTEAKAEAFLATAKTIRGVRAAFNIVKADT